MSSSDRNAFIARLQDVFKTPTSEGNAYIYANSIYASLGFDSPTALLSSLCNDKIIYKISMSPQKNIKRYLYCTMPDPDLYQIVNAFWEKTYFCNLTAVYFHNLTTQIPQVVYVARESIGRQSDAKRKKVVLSDAKIFQSFIKPHRCTKNIYKFDKGSVIFTERVDSDRIGIIKTTKSSKLLPPCSAVSSLERTLIDACVNPQYNGGITSVISYFLEAKKRIDTELLIKIYKQLNFAYPYWQSIGFICDKAGAKKTADAIYNSFNISNVFYIDHMAKVDWQLNEKWQLRHPRII